MRIVISFMQNQPEPLPNKNKLFGIFDTSSQQMEWISLENLEFNNRIVHGMGMTYVGNTFCAGIIPYKERLTSKLLTINLENGKKQINRLNLIKGIHGICSVDDFRLLATSTQTDIIAEITLEPENPNQILFSDILFNFNPPYDQIKCCLENHDDITYRSLCKIDDHFHINDVCIHPLTNELLFSSFFLNPDEITGRRGAIHGINESGPYNLITDITHPHSIFINSKNNILFCASADFKLHNATSDWTVLLDGYTRGICEDTYMGGYWVGLSAYRKFSKTSGKWEQKFRNDLPEFKYAQLQFVDYNGNALHEIIPLDRFGVYEIFDILPFKEGIWN